MDANLRLLADVSTTMVYNTHVLNRGPAKVSLAALNAVLKELGHAPASQADFAPVLAA